MKHGLIAAADQLVSAVAHRLEHHPKQITALVAALCLTGAGGAYAVASFAPDASDIPVRQILQAIEPTAVVSTADALDVPGLVLFRSDMTRNTDTADTLLARVGVSDAAAADFLRNDPLVRQNLWGRVARPVSVEASESHALQKLTVRWVQDDTTNSFQRLVVEKAAGGFASRLETGTLAASSRLASGVIRSSLFAATDESGIPDAVSSQLADIFSGDIDFRRALRKEDRFAVVYETLEADGEPLRAGRVLSAEFVNNGKTFQALWFQEPGAAKGTYYTLDGNSMRQAYLSSPVAFTRISSGFAMRFHPIQHKWRAHTGVDFAAPTGTPARTVGDGVVEFAGWQNGYGNIVIVKHRGADSTAYAHLSKVNVRVGQSLSQGDIVGQVGSTGWATGPHLHFEFRVNGVFRDPMTIAKQVETIPVSKASRPTFDRLASSMRIQLETANGVQQASAQ